MEKFFEKLILHIDMGNIMFISSSILAIKSWDYVKKIFRALVLMYIKKET